MQNKILLLSSLLLTPNVHAALEQHEQQRLTPAGSQAPLTGLTNYFTGQVTVIPSFPNSDTGDYSGAYVTFNAGARTLWHTHPAGQHIIVVEGIGWTQSEGGKVTEIKAGDVIWCPPNVKHWHGASANHAMTHFVITGTKDGKNVDWLEQVTDEQYQLPTTATQ